MRLACVALIAFAAGCMGEDAASPVHAATPHVARPAAEAPSFGTAIVVARWHARGGSGVESAAAVPPGRVAVERHENEIGTPANALSGT